VSAQVHGVLPAGGRGRRRGHAQGSAVCGADTRSVRRRRQVLRPSGRRLRVLPAGGGLPARVPGGTVWPPCLTPPPWSAAPTCPTAAGGGLKSRSGWARGGRSSFFPSMG